MSTVILTQSASMLHCGREAAASLKSAIALAVSESQLGGATLAAVGISWRGAGDASHPPARKKAATNSMRLLLSVFIPSPLL